jgi:hypothetical protein
MGMVEPIADLERVRLSADRQYNDALSALDRAVVEISRQEALGRDDLARVTTALIIFLQQITAFVETKDRELDARLTQKIEGLAPTIASVAELRTQMTVLQRTTQLITRASAASRTSPRLPLRLDRRMLHPARASTMSPMLGFEDEFRGSEENIEARLRDYLRHRTARCSASGTSHPACAGSPRVPCRPGRKPATSPGAGP